MWTVKKTTQQSSAQPTFPEATCLEALLHGIPDTLCRCALVCLHKSRVCTCLWNRRRRSTCAIYADDDFHALCSPLPGKIWVSCCRPSRCVYGLYMDGRIVFVLFRGGTSRLLQDCCSCGRVPFREGPFSDFPV